MSDIITINPWPKTGGPSQTDLEACELACVYHLQVEMLLDGVEAVAFARREDRDQLWSIGTWEVARRLPAGQQLPRYYADVEFDPGLLVERPATLDPLNSTRAMLDALFRARVGHAWPSEAILPGFITDDMLKAIVGKIDAELKANAAKAEARKGPIVRRAKWHGLNPQPNGMHPDSWSATCPATSHSMYLDTGTNLFMCGYCKEGGSPKELTAFVKRRRQKSRAA